MSLHELAEAFKAARLQSRQTQLEVATASGVSLLTVSKFERGAVRELGVVKLIALLRTVGLELQVRPAGATRTLEDLARELDEPLAREVSSPQIRRVRHPRRHETGK